MEAEGFIRELRGGLAWIYSGGAFDNLAAHFGRSGVFAARYLSTAPGQRDHGNFRTSRPARTDRGSVRDAGLFERGGSRDGAFRGLQYLPVLRRAMGKEPATEGGACVH